MSKQTIKELWKLIPNKTPEQVDAYNKFYSEQPEDAYKTFATQAEFDEYLGKKVSEKTTTLETKVKEYEEKPKLEGALKAFKEAGYKESMFKYIKEQAYSQSEDGMKSFNDKATTSQFWKGVVEKLDDKDNYAAADAKPAFPSIKSGILPNGDVATPKRAAAGTPEKQTEKKIYF